MLVHEVGEDAAVHRVGHQLVVEQVRVEVAERAQVAAGVRVLRRSPDERLHLICAAAEAHRMLRVVAVPEEAVQLALAIVAVAEADDVVRHAARVDRRV